MRQHRDRFGKSLFVEVLGPYAAVEAGSELLPHSFKADVLVHPARELPADVPGAGLLCSLLRARAAVLEPFSGTPRALELRSAQAKLPLALYLEQQRLGETAQEVVRGCLLVISHGGCAAVEAVFGAAEAEIEPGLLRWAGPDPVFWLRTDLIGERPETLVFRLLARGERRDRAMAEVEERQLEPYLSIVRSFTVEYTQMKGQAPGSTGLAPEELAEMREVAEAHARALRTLGREEGRQEGRQEGLRHAVLRLVARRWPGLEGEAADLIPAHAPQEALEDLLDGLASLGEVGAALETIRSWHGMLPARR